MEESRAHRTELSFLSTLGGSRKFAHILSRSKRMLSYQQVPQQHDPREPIPWTSCGSKLQQHTLSSQLRRRRTESRNPANIHRCLQNPITRHLWLRRLLLRPKRRRRCNPRLTQQRVEARPLHQSPTLSRSRRLRRLRFQQPKRTNHRGYNHRPPPIVP